MLYILLALLACLTVGACAILRQPQFGKHPEGERLARIESSPHYSDGAFHNLEATPSFTGQGGQFSAMAQYFLAPKKRLKPSSPLPVTKTNLKMLDADKDILVWLGHSSCYLQLGGKRILIDPVFGNHASPFSFSTKAFSGQYPYSAEDMPEIDYLLITHDHWDHLEYPTALALKNKTKLVVCPLGVGAHLSHWGYGDASIHEGDWFTMLETESGLRIHFTPARHFSGRTLTRNKSLWTGFILETPQKRVYVSGDGGYGKHFADAGMRFGGFDLAILENGQYDKNWKYVHMAPEEVALAALDLHAKAILPVHSGRFAIANHAWDDPFIRLYNASKSKNYHLLTPIIGQAVFLDDTGQSFTPWWQGLE